MASHMKSIELAAAGIDVGYHNTKFTLGRVKMDQEGGIAADLFPSVAPLLASEFRADGEIAQRDDGFVVQVEGCDYFVGKDVANYVAGQEARALTRNFSQTDKYLALSYGALLSMIQKNQRSGDLVIDHLTVGLPLSTYMEHRAALRDRMQGKHVLSLGTVTIQHVHVIPQPQGALLHHAARCKSSLNGWMLVIDVGGGTVDWYVASKQRPNFTRSGAYAKGMLACALAVVNSMGKPEWRDNHDILSRIDRAIREESSTFHAAQEDQPLQPHLPAVEAVQEEIASRMVEKLGTLDDIDHVVITGGGAKVFRRFLTKHYPRLAAHALMDADPVFANVMGFHLFSELSRARAQQA